jgi:hypothetical protein
MYNKKKQSDYERFHAAESREQVRLGSAEAKKRSVEDQKINDSVGIL